VTGGELRPVLRYAGSFAALKIPPEGAIIEVPPGTWWDRQLFRTDSDVTIRWLDPTAPRPKFFGSFALSTPDRDRPGLGSLGLVGLELETPTGLPGMDGVAFVSGRKLVIADCSIHGFKNGVMGSHMPPGHWTEVEIRRTEIFNCGQGGNLSHNVYMSRVGGFTFEDNYSHDSRGGHALKYIALDARIRNNRLSNQLGGTTLIDGVACGTSVVAGNTVERWARPGNKYLMELRRRKSICGADLPFGPYLLNDDGWPYDLGGSKVPNTVEGQAIRDPRFWDPAFWWEVAAAGVGHDNPWLFQHFVSGNTFIEHGAPRIPKGIALRNVGTAPVEITLGEDTFVLMEPPEGWVERAVVWAARNSFEGDFQEHYDSSLAPIVDLGDVETLPEWFRT